MKKTLSFLAALTLPLLASGQSPGGVSTDLSVWYKAGNGVTTNGSKLVTQWASSSTNSVTLTPNGSAILPYNDQTTYTNTFNFNPTVTFNGTNNYLRNTTTAYLNTAGSVHYIVVAKGVNRTTSPARCLFAVVGDDDGFFYSGAGATTAFPTIGNNYNVAAAAITSIEDLGIYSAILPKTAVQGIQRGFYNGLKKNYPSPYPYTGTNYILPATGAYIGADGTSGDNFLGDIAEVILYHNTGGGDLADANLEKIHSYLAVKYGITLTSSQNYLASANQVVWNAATNTGFTNNIFGIGRDNASALHQKQSKSTNTGQKLVIGNASTLFSTNDLNTNNLTDGQFLLVGDNGLKQAPTVALSNPGAQTNYRFASLWKVQNTGSVGPVTVAWPTGLDNLQLVRSSDAVIDASDTFIPMTGTTTVNGITYNTASVTLNDGEYFTFAAYVHAPGGVLSSLWYRADKGLAPTTGAVTNWTDYSSRQISVIPALANTTSAPLSVDGIGLNLNFNPGVTFVPANALGNTSVLNAVSGSNYTVYTSTTPVTGSGWDRVVGLNYSNLTGGSSYDTPGFAADNLVLMNPAGSYLIAATVASGYRYNQLTNTSIVRNNFTNTLFTRALNGAVSGGNISYSNTTTGPDGGIIFGRNANNGGDDGGTGMTMAETIVFDGTLSANDINRVDSYLAIKGGITLDANTSNYLSSTSATVWNGSANTGYNNNIFGIANDFVSALYQKQSKSINSGQKLIIGAGGTLANTNILNANSLTDGQFLIVGDNGLKQGLSVPISGISGVNYRFGSIWKTQNTGSVGTVRVAWPSGLTALRLIQSSDAIIDNTDTVTDMSVNTQTVNGVTYNYADVTLANGQYFTFAAFGHSPGGVINGLSQWYRADIDAANTGNGTDVTSWKDYFAGTVSAQIVSNALPKYKIGDVTYFNFNPGINFTAITQTLGNITTQTITNINNDVFTVTKEGMTSPSSPTPHFFSISQDNVTTSIAAWDYLGFWPISTLMERRVVGGGTQFVDSAINFSPVIPSIMYNTFTNTTLARGLNGAANGSTASYAAVGLGLGGHVFGDTRWTGNSSDNGGIIGHIGETIIYGGGNITAAERRKVDTYLAIKYGITLGRVATDNYVSSADAAVWNGALNTTYNNNIFGLAKDDISSLHQKVSRSVNAGVILTLATNNDFVSENLAASRTALSGDQKFFMAGDNNVTAAALSSITVNGFIGQRIQRAWLSQRTNSTGSLYFEANLSSYGAPFGSGNNVRMIIADDAAFSTNVISVPGTFTGGKWVYNHTFDSENTNRYITYAILPVDTDGDGVPDYLDLDNDNDGILDTAECVNANAVTSGVFPTTGGNTNTIPGWTVGGTTNASGSWNSAVGKVNLGSSGLQFIRDESTVTTLGQNIANLFTLNPAQISLNNVSWVKTTTSSTANQFVFTVSYGGIIYATIDSTTGNTPTVTGNNGASVNISTLATVGGTPPATGTQSSVTPNLIITLPAGVSTNGLLEFKFTAGSGVGTVRDLFIGSVSIASCGDTDGDGIPDYLDLDSDNDGCLDAIEGDENVTAAQLVAAGGSLSAGVGSSASNQNLCASGSCVDAQGVPIIVNSGGAADIGGDQGQGAGISKNAAANACIDTDGDGVPDYLDLDNDNDGILDSVECGSGNRITRGDFTVLPATTGNLTAAQIATATGNAWTLVSSAVVTNPVAHTVYWGPSIPNFGNGLQINADGKVQTLTQSLTNVNAVTTDAAFPQILFSKFMASNGGSGGTTPGQTATFTLSYAGVSYVTITTTDGLGNDVLAISYANGATGNFAATTMATAMNNWVITLPNTVANSGSLVLGYTNSSLPGISGDDFNIGDIAIITCKDTDGDGIPDYLDLDSDNDGCLDALEGGDNLSAFNLVPAGGTVTVGVGSAASNQNLCNVSVTAGCVGATGIPLIVNQTTGQTAGTSANSAVKAAACTVCYRPAVTTGSTLDSKVGITALGRAGSDDPDNWPMVRKGAWLVLEAKTKGFVPNRVAFTGANPVGMTVANFVEGMIVYDTTNNCLKMYTSTDNGVTFGWYCIGTQTCPD